MNRLFLLMMLLLSGCCLKAQTAMDIAGEMIPGINLGNTMEACPCNWLSNKLDWETGWQRTKTTQKVIDCFRDQGFKSVRIPCSWFMHTDANYNIDKPWMDRVQEIVDYCIKDDLYVLLNDHWDNGWVENSFNDLSESTQAEKCRIMKILWTQIAERFKDYDYHLLFGGLNEPNAGDDKNKIAALIRYEQAFIDAVRATGGNNEKRILVVQGPDTNIEHTYNYFNINNLKDSASDALMMEVHFYGPYNFVMMEKDESWGNMAYYWGAANHVSGSTHNSTWGEENWVMQQFNMMKKKFAQNGIPTIIGEYGAIWRKMPSGENQDKHDASVKLWYQTVTKYAISSGCVPMVWDTNSDRGLINRTTCSVVCKAAMEGITEGVNKVKWNYASSLDNIPLGSKSGDTRMYNLQGVQVDENYHGIVIKNGHKFMR